MYPWIHFQCIRGYIFDTKAWKSPSSSGCAAVVPAQRPTPGDYDHQNRTSPVVMSRRAVREHVGFGALTHERQHGALVFSPASSLVGFLLRSPWALISLDTCGIFRGARRWGVLTGASSIYDDQSVSITF